MNKCVTHSKNWNTPFELETYACARGMFFGALFRNHISPYRIEGLYLHEIAVFVIGIILIALFISGMYVFRVEHENMVYTIIRNQTLKNSNWKSEIPQEFFTLTKKESSVKLE